MESDRWFDFSSGGDLLKRRAAAEALQRMLSDGQVATPLVLGIYGGWGTGKTSLMRTLLSLLNGPATLHLWFDAWVYARQEEALWRALLLRVIESLRQRTIPPTEQGLTGAAFYDANEAFRELWDGDEAKAKTAQAALDEGRASLYRSMTATEKGRLRVNLSGAIPLVADAAVAALTAGISKDIAKAIGGKDGPDGIFAAVAKWVKDGSTKEVAKLVEREATERYVEQVGSLEQFQTLFRGLLTQFGIGDGQEGRGTRRLFIFVDDLDRCLPEDAVAALEAIKLFLDMPGCVFVLGMDRVVVEQGISVRYASLEKAGFDAGAYLDKIIQVPFNLPPLGERQIDGFLDTLSKRMDLGEVQELIRLASPANPRALKRVLNALVVTYYMDDAQPDALSGIERPKRRQYLAKLVLLQVCFERVWRAVAAPTVSLIDLEEVARSGKGEMRAAVTTLSDLGGLKMEALFRQPPLFKELTPEQRAELLSFARITESTTPPATDEAAMKAP